MHLLNFTVNTFSFILKHLTMCGLRYAKIWLMLASLINFLYERFSMVFLTTVLLSTNLLNLGNSKQISFPKILINILHQYIGASRQPLIKIIWYNNSIIIRRDLQFFSKFFPQGPLYPTIARRLFLRDASHLRFILSMLSSCWT